MFAGIDVAAERHVLARLDDAGVADRPPDARLPRMRADISCCSMRSGHRRRWW